MLRYYDIVIYIRSRLIYNADYFVNGSFYVRTFDPFVFMCLTCALVAIVVVLHFFLWRLLQKKLCPVVTFAYYTGYKIVILFYNNIMTIKTIVRECTITFSHVDSVILIFFDFSFSHEVGIVFCVEL